MVFVLFVKTIGIFSYLHFANFLPAADFTPLLGLFFKLYHAPEHELSDFDFDLRFFFAMIFIFRY